MEKKGRGWLTEITTIGVRVKNGYAGRVGQRGQSWVARCLRWSRQVGSWGCGIPCLLCQQYVMPCRAHRRWRGRCHRSPVQQISRQLGTTKQKQEELLTRGANAFIKWMNAFPSYVQVSKGEGREGMLNLKVWGEGIDSDIVLRVSQGQVEPTKDDLFGWQRSHIRQHFVLLDEVRTFVRLLNLCRISHLDELF